jgi:hypothetical protein
MEMKRQVSMLTTMNRACVSRLAEMWSIPAPNREAFIDQSVHALNQVWADSFGGERVRVWVAGLSDVERAARRARILAAIDAGEPLLSIAKRERVRLRWVQKLRQQQRADDVRQQQPDLFGDAPTGP